MGGGGQGKAVKGRWQKIFQVG